MRNQLINETKHYVLNFKGKEEVEDSDGYYTGESTISYSKPIAFKGHLSSAKGSSQVAIFGTDVMYDKTIVITKKRFAQLKITENSVFFIDKKPSYENGTPLYDYRVKKIAETINEVAIALIKVEQQ